MAKGRLAAAAASVFGIGLLGAYLTYQDSVNDQAGRHAEPTGELQLCIDEAVKIVYPDMEGGFMEAADRWDLYQEYGDMMHYRDRGWAEINSITLSPKSGHAEQGLKAETPVQIFVRTDRSPIVVLPWRVQQWGIDSPLTDTFTSFQSIPSENDNNYAVGDYNIKVRHEAAVNAIKACFK